MTLAEYRTELAAVEAKILELLGTGQEYSVVGSHSVKNPELTELEQQRTRLRRRILRLQGYNTSRTVPNFEG
jgi:hypothetical protein